MDLARLADCLEAGGVEDLELGDVRIVGYGQGWTQVDAEAAGVETGCRDEYFRGAERGIRPKTYAEDPCRGVVFVVLCASGNSQGARVSVMYFRSTRPTGSASEKMAQVKGARRPFALRGARVPQNQALIAPMPRRSISRAVA